MSVRCSFPIPSVVSRTFFRRRYRRQRRQAGLVRGRLFRDAVQPPHEAPPLTRPQLIPAFGRAGAVCRPPRAHHIRHTDRVLLLGARYQGWDREAVYNALDNGIVRLLEYGRRVYSLTLDLNLTKTLNYFPKTLSALAQVRIIRNLCLAPFYPPTYAAESSPPLDGVPGEEPPAYEHVSLKVCSGGWLPIMMRDPRKSASKCCPPLNTRVSSSVAASESATRRSVIAQFASPGCQSIQYPL
jgi:hypothetical protein